MAKEAKNKKEKKHFFKDFKAELKKVIWPTPKQVVNNTVAVITIVLITAVIVLVLDLVFETMNTYGINKLREAVVQEENIVNSVENSTDGAQIVETNTVIENETLDTNLVQEEQTTDENTEQTNNVE